MSYAIVCDDGEGNHRSDCDVTAPRAATAREAWAAAKAEDWKKDGSKHYCPVCLYGQTQ